MKKKQIQTTGASEASLVYATQIEVNTLPSATPQQK
uniref:Uncharacterized protein n=3 Tax=Myxococcaceae TaxID=31 RepID=A0A3S7UZ66_9BACT|nr:hypothetical protein [Corallococcus coralloides]AYM53989.1 hypothetical protein [Pyxidicoccus sp.]AYM54036.1 hypothetical protein [Pyxidicoccus fallax]